MNLLSGISYGAAAFAFLAAIFWFWSAIVKTPQQFRITAIAGGDLGSLGGPVGGGRVYPATSQDLNDLAAALKKQSRLSAMAAIFAGISALLGASFVLLSSLN